MKIKIEKDRLNILEKIFSEKSYKNLDCSVSKAINIFEKSLFWLENINEKYMIFGIDKNKKDKQYNEDDFYNEILEIITIPMEEIGIEFLL